MTDVVIGIDASRNRSGGAKAHLVGVLAEADPSRHGIRRVHVWSYKSLLDSLPDVPWLVKHNPPELERSLLSQAWWQFRSLSAEAQRLGCDIMLNTDAGTIGGFQPSVVMSRDMLSYEAGEMNRFGFTRARLRLILLRYIQNRSMRVASGVIFLTNYAAQVIQGVTGTLAHVAVIPHGVSSAFKQVLRARTWPREDERAVECLYVSNAAMYKHQWVVVRAIGELRRRGRNVRLTLVGGGTGPAQELLDREITRTDPAGTFVTSVGYVSPERLPAVLADADMFVFASSCENMPNTLLEAMAVGLPIACSNRGPMPEVLAEGGVYFDPENADSITEAIERVLCDSSLREACAARARSLATQYSWSRCGSETWNFLLTTIKRQRK